MSCPSESDLVKMVSGELTGDRHDAVMSHLDQCATCAQRADELRRAWRAMGAWQVDTSGHDVSDRVLIAVGTRPISAEQGRWGRPWQWPVPLRAAASLLLAVGIGWGTGRWTGRPDLQGPTPGPRPAEPVTAEAVAREMNLGALTGGAPTGLALTWMNEELQASDMEEKG